MDEVIKVKGLTKIFSYKAENQTTLDLLLKILTLNFQSEKFCALNNITFMIKKGERTGLIGDNGSGKTTLLRILCNLYDKTSGEIDIKGKVAALLRVDSGIEWTLSAKENIYLIGMMFGIKKRKIEKIFGDIVNFAEIKESVNVPIGDFSSGMLERLAFAIFKYVDADILLIDELLASGDIHFKEKSYKILQEFVTLGKTMIITSHDMEVVTKFCNKAMILKKGRLIAYGPAKEIIRKYRNLKS